MSASFPRFLFAAALPLCLIVVSPLPHLSQSAYANTTALPFNPDEYAAYQVQPPDGQAAAIRFTGEVTDANGRTLGHCRYGQGQFGMVRIVPDTPFFAEVITAEINGQEFPLSDEARNYFAVTYCDERAEKGIVSDLPALPFMAWAQLPDGGAVVVHVVLQAGRMTEVVFSNENVVRPGEVVKAANKNARNTTAPLPTVPLPQAPPPALKWK